MKKGFKLALGTTLCALAMVGAAVGCGSAAQKEEAETKQYLSSKAYNTVVNQYKNFIDATNGDKKDVSDSYDNYEYVAIGSCSDEADEGNLTEDFFYATADINGDEKEELVIGIRYAEEEDIRVIGLFTEKNDEPVSLLALKGLDAQAAFAYEIPVYLHTNQYTIDMTSADEGILVCDIDTEKCEPIIKETYVENYNFDNEQETVTYTSEDGTELTGDEFQELLGLGPVLDYQQIQ